MDEWVMKMEAFERTWMNGRASKNLLKYIPYKVSDGVSYVHTDSDGYWVYLNPGWKAYGDGEDCHIIHAYSIADLKDDIKTIRRVKLEGDDNPGKWICRQWTETNDGWISDYDVFDTENDAIEQGLAFERNHKENELSREFEVYKG